MCIKILFAKDNVELTYHGSVIYAISITFETINKLLKFNMFQAIAILN